MTQATEKKSTRVIQRDNTELASEESILTKTELALAKELDAVFYLADEQIPNSYIDIGMDAYGYMVKKPVYDDENPKYIQQEMLKINMFNPKSLITEEVHHYVTPLLKKRFAHQYRRFIEGDAYQAHIKSEVEMRNDALAAELAEMREQLKALMAGATKEVGATKKEK